MKFYQNIQKKIVDLEDLGEIRGKHRDEKIVFATGCFDVFHIGHSRFLKKSKQKGDILVASVAKDSTVRLLKGPSRPINPELHRLYLIGSINEVDYILMNEDMEKKGKADQYLETKVDYEKILRQLKPDSLIMATDTISSQYKKELCQQLDIDIEIIDRKFPPEIHNNTSTTRIIDTVIEKNQ